MITPRTVTVRLEHKSSIPNTRWCEPVGWEPTNVIEGSEWIDGSWWDDYEETAGLVWFGPPNEYGGNEVEGSEWIDGSWWDDYDETAALARFGPPNEYGGEVVEVSLDDLRVVSCGECRVIGPVKL